MTANSNSMQDYNGQFFKEEDVVKISYLLENIWNKRSVPNGNNVFSEWLFLYYPETLEEILQSKLKEEGFLNQLTTSKKPNIQNIDWSIHFKFKKRFIDLAKEMIQEGIILVRDMHEKFNGFITNDKDFEYYRKNLNKVFDINFKIEQTPKEWEVTQFTLEEGLAKLQESYRPEYLENILHHYVIDIEDATGFFSDKMYEEFNWSYQQLNNIKKYDIKLFIKAVDINGIQAPSSLTNNEYLEILKDFLGSNITQSEKFDMLFNNQEELWDNMLFDRLINNGMLVDNIQLSAYTPKEFEQEFSEDIKSIQKERDM